MRAALWRLAEARGDGPTYVFYRGGRAWPGLVEHARRGGLRGGASLGVTGRNPRALWPGTLRSSFASNSIILRRALVVFTVAALEVRVGNEELDRPKWAELTRVSSAEA